MDGLALDASSGSWRCARGHGYDVAQEGYCNLLLVQHKASRDPGDSKEMVAARRRFLDAGHYAPIAERIFFIISGAFRDRARTPAHIVDAGCGEGYYLARLADLSAKHRLPVDIQLAGIDVSKWAVRAAARRDTPAAWAVASNRQPPFVAGSVDLILCIFGFPHWKGFAGVLGERGHVLLADPGPDHLIELRRVIYPDVRQSPPPSLEPAEKAGFALAAEERLMFKVGLASKHVVQDLLLMTPHGVRVPRERRGEVDALERLEVTVDVRFRLMSRRSG
jgi:23S rRNA (guanine745-N1)-methyltransferase